MRICMIGAGYVGLVVCRVLLRVQPDGDLRRQGPAAIGRVEGRRVADLRAGLDHLLRRNMQASRLLFTDDLVPAAKNADVILLAVGTSVRRGDGYADHSSAVEEIAPHLKGFTVIVTKSTVE